MPVPYGRIIGGTVGTVGGLSLILAAIRYLRLARRKCSTHNTLPTTTSEAVLTTTVPSQDDLSATNNPPLRTPSGDFVLMAAPHGVETVQIKGSNKSYYLLPQSAAPSSTAELGVPKKRDTPPAVYVDLAYVRPTQRRVLSPCPLPRGEVASPPPRYEDSLSSPPPAAVPPDIGRTAVCHFPRQVADTPPDRCDIGES